MSLAHPFDDDKLREECGVFGIIGVQEAANFVALGLHALQHRGQEAGGIVAYTAVMFSSDSCNAGGGEQGGCGVGAGLLWGAIGALLFSHVGALVGMPVGALIGIEDEYRISTAH